MNFIHSPNLSGLRRCLFLALIAVAAPYPAHADVEDVLKRIQRDGSARVIVRMKADAGAAAWSAAQPAPRQREAVAAALEKVQPSLRGARINAYKTFRTLPLVSASVTQVQLNGLMSSPEVESISLVRRERKLADNAGIRPSLERPQLAGSVPSIDVLGAWAKGYDGTGYAVAVIDDGVNLNHPMLKGKNVGDACFSADFGTTTKNNCPSGQSPQFGPGAASNCPANSSRCDHGTHVSSIAVGNDGINFGVARGAKLVPIDVFSVDTDPADCSPDPAPCELTDSLAVLDALDYVNEHAAKFKIAAVNLSLGGAPRDGYCDDDPRKGVIDMLRLKGIAVAAAASNDGLTGKISPPACISSAVSVGATNDGTTVASFSNFSSITDFMAPGVSILAAAGSGSGLASKSGTSSSSPHVAGAWAVLRSAFPAAQFDQLETALKQTGIPVTRQNAGYSVPKIQLASAIIRLQGSDRRIINNVVSSTAPAAGESYLRFFNTSASAGTVTVTLRDSGTGTALATWTSPSIPPQASPQVAIETIESMSKPSGIVIVPSGAPYYNVEVASTFSGYVQHVLWTRSAGVFANLSSCASGVAVGSSNIPNVHATSIRDYASRIRIVNTGATTDHAVLTFNDSLTGATIGQWTSKDIASGASLEVTAAQLENELKPLGAAVSGSLQQYNVRLSNLAGYLQHVMQNVAVGALVDMTAKCELGIASAGPATPATAAAVAN